jgi:hypothetical protein
MNKYTNGYVRQEFDNDGNLVGQEFVASCDSDAVEYTGTDGYKKPLEDAYAPFDMAQPTNN